MRAAPAAVLTFTILLAACSGDGASSAAGPTARASDTAARAPTPRQDVATPAAAATSAGAPPSPTVAPIASREPLIGGPYPTLLVAQAQFTDAVGADGKKPPVPGPAKLLLVRRTPQGWKTLTLEDRQSNAFHKAVPFRDGFLTLGATEARLKFWHYAGRMWREETMWNPHFGGKFDRLRDAEMGNPDGYGADELVLATHDQGVVVALHPDRGWTPERIDQQKDTFVHEIELGDVDGDGRQEVFATPSKPNKLEEEQSGEVTMYKKVAGEWQRSVVDAPGDTHAKEILAADVDKDRTSELYVVWEGAIGAGAAVTRPVTIKQYRWRDGAFTSAVVATLPDRQMRALAAGDVNGDGKVDLVGGAMASGLWLFEQGTDPTAEWKKTAIDPKSSGFEHPVHLADLDGDGKLEIYVAAEDQHVLRMYHWTGSGFANEVVTPLHPGDITWNITSAKL